MASLNSDFSVPPMRSVRLFRSGQHFDDWWSFDEYNNPKLIAIFIFRYQINFTVRVL